MGRSCSQNGRMYECFQNLTGTPAGKRPLVRPRHRWGDYIRMDLQEIGINTRNWVDLALVNATLNLRLPYDMELVNQI